MTVNSINTIIGNILQLLKFTIDDYYFETLFVEQASRKSILFNYSFKDLHNSKFYPYRNNENILGKIMNGLIIKSNVQIPVSHTEIFDLKIEVEKNNKIKKYTINYRNYNPPKFKGGSNNELLPGYTYEDISSILVRTDHDHEETHLNINYFKETASGRYEKINDKSIDFIEQEITVGNYQEGGLEQLITLVLVQAEKLNPFIGIKYWLLSSFTHINENNIFKLWSDSNVETPLCILANNIMKQILDEPITRSSKIDQSKVLNFVNIQLQLIKDFEKVNPECSPIKLLQQPMDFKLPFPMIAFPGFNVENIVIHMSKEIH